MSQFDLRAALLADKANDNPNNPLSHEEGDALNQISA